MWASGGPMKLRYKILGVLVILVAVGVLSLAFAMSHTSACGPSPPPPAGVTLMKGIVYRCYGSPDVLRYEDIAKPTAADNEVLVRVHAASVNPLDWHEMEGTPYIGRLDDGFGKPKNPRLGVDFAGTVEAVGKNVKRFKPGDEVFGADVTGVCRTRNVDLVRSIGADHVIDYTREDFTQGGQHYDLILDNVATHSLLEYKRALNPKGIYVMIVSTTIGNWFAWLATPIEGLMLSPFVSQKFGMIVADLNKEDLATLGDLMQSGKLTPVIDRRYKLSETPEALRYVEKGHARGKVVVTVD